MEIYKPGDYQKHGTAHIKKYNNSGIFMEMGLGKTVVTLTAIVEMRIRKTLVIAPLAVAEDTWPDEIAKWQHTAHLRVSRILGTPAQRKAALRKDADVYTINVENVPWIIAELEGKWIFDMLVIDELSKFKSAKSKRFKALRPMLPKIKRIVGLTGTPMPNSLMDLWSQLYLLDQGQRLGKTLTGYREKYFKPDKQSGHIVYSYKLKTEDKDSLLGPGIWAAEVFDKISDICISMKLRDYRNLPDKVIRNWEIPLRPEVMAKYTAFEEELVMEMADKEVTVANAGVLVNKLLQFSNGAIYDDDKVWHEIHTAKLDALEDLVEEAQGQPVLVIYNYKHDLQRINKRLRGYDPKSLKLPENRAAWNRKEIAVATGHPKSMGHGLNLQAGGNIVVWFGIQWSLEDYQQAISRLDRLGQTKPVFVHHLLGKGTMDAEVLQALTRKDGRQESLMRAVKAKINYYKNNGI